MPQATSRPSASAYEATSVSPARHDRKRPRNLGDMMRTIAVLMAMATSLIGLVGCGDDDEAGPGNVDVTLSDFKIELGSDSAPAGEVTFKVDNHGPSVHEFVVFQTDLAADDLPVDESGDVAESDEFAPVDEIEDIAVDATPELVVDLDAGRYVLICNVPAHYRQGMSTPFTVN